MKRTKRANENKPKTARKPPSASNHKLVPVMPEGSILTDLMKKQWKLGKPVGSGGFGMIYLTQQNSSSPVKEVAEFVMKLEPVDNGPLFCELHFYMRAAKPEMIKEWKKTYGMKSLGVPEYIASGQQEINGTKIRFMVMQRFGNDLQKVFEQNGKQFPMHTVFLLGLELIDALEYIHDKGYVHADIKAANLMTGYKDPNQVYLIDYGLAFRFIQDGKHKEYKEDPRKAHDGTIEFTSRDAHKGVAPSRRGDLEILAYCMLQWFCQKLPWENNLQNKNYVRDQKIRYMSDIPTLLTACLHGKSVPAEFGKFLTYVSELKYDEKPSYDRCSELFIAALKKLGHKETDKLDFVVKKVKTVTPAKNRKRASSEAWECSASPQDSMYLVGSPSVDEEATETSAKNRKKLPAQSPLARKPQPVGPKKPGQASVADGPTAANSIPSSTRNPIAIAARKSNNSASGKGGRRPAASRLKLKHSDIASSPVTLAKNRKRASSSESWECSASPQDSMYLVGSPSVDEATEPSATKRRKLSSQSPLARKPRPAGPKKPGQTSVADGPAAANSIPSSTRNPIAIAARKSISASGKGVRRLSAYRLKKSRVAKVVSSIGVQTSPGLRGLPHGRLAR